MKTPKANLPGILRIHDKANSLIATSSLALLLALPAGAATIIPVTNHSFEANLAADGAASVSAPTGWTKTSGAAVSGYWNPQDGDYPGSTAPGTLPAPADGVNTMFVNGGTWGYMKQTTGEVIAAGKTYTMTVAVGARLTGNFDADNILLRLGYGADNFLIPIADNTFGGTANLTAGEFKDFSVSFTALEGETYIGQNLAVLMGMSLFDAANTAAVDFDNVRLTAIPEPSAALLGGLGLLALLRRRR
jgi:hypothetical protein